MLSKILIVIAVAILQLSVAGSESPGKLVNSPYSIAPFYNFASTCDQAGIYAVCDSFKSVLICIQGESEKKVCPTDKPYCNKNVCSTTPSSEYEYTPDPLKCTGEGFYPDPKQCQFYHYCEAAGQDSFIYDCEAGYEFNPVTQLCKQKIPATNCTTVTCDDSNVFQKYGTSKTYFGYCTADGEIIMLKCEENYFFDGNTCVFQCPKVGKFAHTDPSKYNECYFSGFKLVSREMKCPVGKEFNLEKQVCLTPQ